MSQTSIRDHTLSCNLGEDFRFGPIVRERSKLPFNAGFYYRPPRGLVTALKYSCVLLPVKGKIVIMNFWRKRSVLPRQHPV
jgi:hypothetical protein